MYSTRFSTFENNPDLQPERSHYGQVGVADTFWGMRIPSSTCSIRTSMMRSPRSR
jgi:hypothetical protein